MTNSKRPKSQPTAKKPTTLDDLQEQLNVMRQHVAYCVDLLDEREPHPSDAAKWRILQRVLRAALDGTPVFHRAMANREGNGEQQ